MLPPSTINYWLKSALVAIQHQADGMQLNLKPATRSGKNRTMQNILGQITLLVDEYDKAITYYTELLEFELLEDTSITENILGLASVAWLLRLFL
jgi:hypothetical protein